MHDNSIEEKNEMKTKRKNSKDNENDINGPNKMITFDVFRFYELSFL